MPIDSSLGYQAEALIGRQRFQVKKKRSNWDRGKKNTIRDVNVTLILSQTAEQNANNTVNVTRLHSAFGAGLTVASPTGVASFTDLLINGTGGNLTLLFTHVQTGLTVNITALECSRNASSFSILQQPSSSALGGVPFAVQPVVALRDSAGLFVSNTWGGPTRVTASLRSAVRTCA